VADVLRFGYEIRDAAFLDVPSSDLGELSVSPQEIEMAEQLVEATVTTFDPAAYHDTYRDDLLAMIDRKVASGETHVVTEQTEAPAAEPGEGAQVIDIMALLKRSVEKARAEAPGDGAAPKRARKQA
jgi:DNA end-binding protein Ku